MPLIPRASILIRTIESRIELLKRALRSVENQSIAKDLELIVIEDGSCGSENYVKELLKNSPLLKIQYFSLPKSNRSFTGNYALQKASAPYANFLDDDDELYSDHAEKLLSILEKAPPQTVAAYALSEQLPSQIENLCPLEIQVGLKKVVYNEHFSLLKILTQNFFPIQSVMFRTQTALAVGGMRTELPRLEDWIFYAELALMGDFEKYEDHPTSFYRVPLSRAALKAQHSLWLEALPLARKIIESRLQDNSLLLSQVRSSWSDLDAKTIKDRQFLSRLGRFVSKSLKLNRL